MKGLKKMPDLVAARLLIQAVKDIALYLNEKEIASIVRVLNRAEERILREQES